MPLFPCIKWNVGNNEILTTYLTTRGIRVDKLKADPDVVMIMKAVERTDQSNEDPRLQHRRYLEQVGFSCGYTYLAHAFTGCDTTNRIHGAGSGKDRLVQIITNVDDDNAMWDFLCSYKFNANKEAGKKQLLRLISSTSPTLDAARLAILEQKALSTSTDIKCPAVPKYGGCGYISPQ